MDAVTMFGYPMRVLIDDVEGETVDVTEAILPIAAQLDPQGVRINATKVLDLIHKAQAERYCPCCRRKAENSNPNPVGP